MLAFLLIATRRAQPATHEAGNRSTRDCSIPVSRLVRTCTPSSRPDHARRTRRGQAEAAITALIDGVYAYDEFTRNANVAPYLLKLGDVEKSDPKAPARTVDAWFIVYGDLKALDDEKFLESLLDVGRGSGNSKTIKKEDLVKRKFEVPDEKKEGYGNIEFDFLDKVRIRATGHAMWSKTDESVAVAVEVDPRFRGDKEFPNEWQSITKDDGTRKLGPATPWSGSGLYLKITRLAEPKGALFCEQHVIFAEPKGWFDDANLLRSKLPLAVQSNVRSMRKEWAKYNAK